MKLTIKQLNNIKQFIKESEQLKAVYSSCRSLWFSDYYNCWNFEYTAETSDGIKYSDLVRFSEEELNELINE